MAHGTVSTIASHETRRVVAPLSSYFTLATNVRGIKEHLGLGAGLCNGQAAIDRDEAAVIGVTATVRPVHDE
mgnify:CR=1 FL=1